MTLKLYSYWRSSASYRVRIALALKNLEYQYVPVNIVKDGGEQHRAEYRALNPQARVPLLVDGDFALAQSLAILEYLEARFPAPALVPADARERARMWAFCHTIAADIQPLQNTGPLGYLARELGVGEEQRNAWIRHWVERGLGALEQELRGRPETRFALSDTPTLADCVLLPQIYNAERFACDSMKYPRLLAVAQRCRALPEFARAAPEQQPDANLRP